MPKLTYAENPVHPVLNDYPAALVPASLAFDMLHLVTRRPTFRNAAFFSLLLAFVTGIPAAIAGYKDYVEIPEGTETKRMANTHAVLNIGLLGAIGLGLFLRMFGRISFFARLLNLTANGALMVSGWYGTHMVYRHGMRVRDVDPIANAPEAGPDAGKPYADRLESLAASVPATDLRTLAAQASDGMTQAQQQAQSALQGAASSVQSRAEEVEKAGRKAQAEATGTEEGEQESLLDVAATSRTSLPDEQQG